MKSKIFILLIFFFSSRFLFADSLTLVNKIEATASFFTTDHLGNLYLVTENGLFKYDPGGKPVSSFSQKNFGIIQFVDASDPMKVLIFNKDFSSAITLDNTLTVQSSFNLRDLNLQQPVLICVSRHDGYWVYDKQTNQLKKFNTSLQPVLEGSDLSQLINSELNPVFLVESEKWLWLSNPSSGVLIFDMFGTYLKTLEIKDSLDVNNFQVNDDKIIFSGGNMLKEINQVDLNEKVIIYKELNDALKIRIEQNRLYVLKKDVFEIYSF
ncbi:MAG TPA: hypothetical protein VJY62_20690 [Bacteroidia bacterium]|nr:hypothetical protein [Bacteroidia bacterium]